LLRIDLVAQDGRTTHMVLTGPSTTWCTSGILCRSQKQRKMQHALVRI